MSEIKIKVRRTGRRAWEEKEKILYRPIIGMKTNMDAMVFQIKGDPIETIPIHILPMLEKNQH